MSRKPIQTRVVNLEEDHPTVNVGLLGLERSLSDARRDGVAVLKLIHGYGSKGVGGKLKHEAAKALMVYKQNGKIRDFVSGEDFRVSNEVTWELLKRAPEIKQDRDLGMNNRGITVVLL